MREALWLLKLKRNINGISATDEPDGTEATDQHPPTQIYADSYGAFAHITTGIVKARTKHIDMQ